MPQNAGGTLDVSAVQKNLVEFLEGRTRTQVDVDLDVFASGLIPSLVALELVVHLEREFNVRIGGPDLRLDNFRTVRAMTDLVLRLSGSAGE